MLPYVHERRRSLAEKSVEHARAFLDCGNCRERTPEAARRSWNCGYLPRLPGNPYVGPALDCEIDRESTCPGYLISLPQVIEASHGHAWWDKGQLSEFCDGQPPTRLMRAAVDLLGGFIGEANVASLRALKKKGDRG